MSILEANNKKLGEVLNLAYGSLYIPFNQRPYEWKKEQVLRLFNDFYAIFISDDENKEHVLNFITIKKEEDKKYIFDGQQRIVTSILIIIGLMQKIKKLDNSDNTIKLLSSLERDYLYKEDFLGDNNKIKYKIVFDKDEANTMLHNYIFKYKEEKRTVLTDYERALYENYNYIKLIIEEKESLKNVDNIKKFIKKILENVELIVIETALEDIAQDMFETLNSTGLKIQDFYILKNQIIKTMGEDFTKDKWNYIEIKTDGLDKKKFLQMYINLKFGKTKKMNCMIEYLKN